MAIQIRRGLKKDFDPNKLRPAEYAIPTDTKEVYVAFSPGDVKRIATWDDFNAEMGAVASATQRAINASESAESLVVNKAGINDLTPTLTEAYSGVKTQELIDNITFENATETSDGLMSKEDKKQVNKIGDLSQLNTTSNTDLVGAINEVNAKPSVSDAIEVAYDNDISGLTSVNVQGAVDEVASQLADIVINVKNYGAIGDGIADDAIPIQNAIDYVYANGGGKVLAKGLFRHTSSIVVKSGVQLIGHGYTTDPDIQGATTFLKDGDFDGIVLSGLYAGIDNCTVDGVDGNGGVGVRHIGGRSFIKNISAINQGGNGFEIGDTIGSKLNLWRAENLLALGNGGDGIYVNSISTGGFPDNNAGYLVGLDARGNGGDGLHVGNSTANVFIGVSCQTNSGRGIRCSDGAEANYFLLPYTEGNLGDVAGEIYLEVGANQNTIEGYRAMLGDSIIDEGLNNYVRGLAQQLGGLPYIKSRTAFKDLIIQNELASGYYEFTQNADKNLEIYYNGSSTTPVKVGFKHGSGGKIILEVDSINIGSLTPTLPINGILHKEVALDCPSIPANSTVSLNTTLSGVALRDTVVAVPEVIANGVMWNAYVSAIDTITLRIANVTTTAIDPVSTPWTFDVISR